MIIMRDVYATPVRAAAYIAQLLDNKRICISGKPLIGV
jgi:hypothetical protein